MNQAHRRWTTSGWWVLAGWLLLYVPAYWQLAQSTWLEEAHAHGPLIGLAAAALLWRDQQSIRGGATRPLLWLAVPMLLTGLMLAWVGMTQDIALFTLASQIPVLSAWLLARFGLGGLRRAGFAVVFLLFMVPVPGFLVDLLTLGLKEWISAATVNTLHALGYPVARSGVIIVIGQYQLLIADACSGLHSLFSLCAVGLLYTHLRAPLPWMHRILLWATIVPAAIAANLLRTGLLVLTTYHLGDSIAQSLHQATGVLVFLGALALLYATDSGLQLLLPRRQSLPHAGMPGWKSVRPQGLSQSRATQTGAWFVGVLVMASAMTHAWTFVHSRASVQALAEPLHELVPHQLGPWQLDTRALVQPISANAARKADAVYATTLERVYVHPNQQRIMLSISYADRQGDGLNAHRPEYCYQAQGFLIDQVRDHYLDKQGVSLPIRTMATHRPGRSEPVSYWMTVGQQATLPGVKRKLAQLRNGMGGQHTGGYLLRVSSLAPPEPSTFALHQQFIADFMNALSPEIRQQFGG